MHDAPWTAHLISRTRSNLREAESASPLETYGSYTHMLPNFMSFRSEMILKTGLSLVSSVFPLNANPSTATLLQDISRDARSIDSFMSLTT